MHGPGRERLWVGEAVVLMRNRAPLARSAGYGRRSTVPSRRREIVPVQGERIRGHVGDEAHRADQGEGANACARERLRQHGRRSEERRSLRNDVVHENDVFWRAERWRGCHVQRRDVVLERRPIPGSLTRRTSGPPTSGSGGALRRRRCRTTRVRPRCDEGPTGRAGP